MRVLRYALLCAASLFSQEARDFERFAGRWNRALAPELIRFAGLSDGARILDYNCGTGAVALRAAARFPKAEILGIDPSTAYVEYARTQSPRATVRFQTTPDLFHLPFPNGEFDAALTIALPPDARQALLEMLRVTKPNGIVAAAVWDYGDGMQPLDLFWDAALAVDPNVARADGPSTPYSKQGQLAELWRSVNVRDVEERVVEVEISYSSFDDYWSPFLAGQGIAGAWLMSQPEAKRSAVREALRSKLLGARGSGPVTLKARAWAVKGIARTAN